MKSVSGSPRGSVAAAGREGNCQAPWHRYACCISDSLLQENLFGELVCGRHEAADFRLSDIFRDEIAEPSGDSCLDEVSAVEGEGDTFPPCCIASRPLNENLFGDVVCVPHEETAFCLFDMFDDGTCHSEGADCPDGAAPARQATRVPQAPHLSRAVVDTTTQMAEQEAEYSRRAQSGNENVSFLRAASTIQKAWRNPAVRATVRTHRARVCALEQAETKRRVWASKTVAAAWRMYQSRVAEAVVTEAEAAEAAVAAVEAMEAATAEEVKTAAAGGASAGGELSCAFCSDRPLYENLFGQLVCHLHEELTFRAQYPSAEAAGGSGAAERGAPESRCPVCDEEISDAGYGRYRKGGRCPFGHVVCAACTTQYVKTTLLPQGTVFWDSIKCVKCAAYMCGMSVRRSIDDEDLVKVVEARQFDAAYLICGERDPLSQEALGKYTKPCPTCNTPTEKNGGCDHMTCFVCKHQYWYSCDCAYPVHTRECDARR